MDNNNHDQESKNNRLIEPNHNEVMLGGGCFWGVEELFKKFKGVIFNRSGLCRW